MRRMKRFALWSIGALGILVALIVVLLAVTGDEFYRWTARQLLKSAIDREVHFDGTFAVDVGLNPTLVFTDAWIENAPWAEKHEMAHVERIEVQFALRQLFSGLIWIRRLVVDDLTIDLEQGPDGSSNWQLTNDDPQTSGKGHPLIPVFEKISLKNVLISYRGENANPNTEVYLDILRSKIISENQNLAIAGNGSLNNKKFTVSGKFGSIEDALAANNPFPLELALHFAGLDTELKGTLQDLTRAEGFDLRLSARALSIRGVFDALERDSALDGQFSATADLRGDLSALSVENLMIRIIESSGQELQVGGLVSDLSNGKGLNIRFTGALDPKTAQLWGRLPGSLHEILMGAERLDVACRITGDFDSPIFEDLEAHLEHGSGAKMSVQARLAVSFLEESYAVEALQASATMSLPDAVLLQRALGTPVPEIGAIHGNSELILEDNWLEIRDLKLNATSFGGFQLSAAGRLAKLSEKNLDVAFHPLIDITATMNESRPLLTFLTKRTGDAETPSGNREDNAQTHSSKPLISGRPSFLSREETPKMSGRELILAIQKELLVAGIDPGPRDGLMGPRTRAAIKRYQAGHDLSIDGRPSTHLLQNLLKSNNSNDNQSVSQRQKSPAQEAIDEDRLPELGPISARTTLSEGNELFALSPINLWIGHHETPLVVHVGGRIEDLLALSGIHLDGVFQIATWKLLNSYASYAPRDKSALGSVGGDFIVSDASGTIGVDLFDAELRNSKLISFSVKGGIDNIQHGDGVRIDASLRVPDVSELGHEFGMEISRVGSLSFNGRISGAMERFQSSGQLRVGATEVSGELTGDLLGERPLLSAKLYSPALHLADLGLQPTPDTTTEVISTEEHLEQPTRRSLFSEKPINFSVLKKVDLNLDMHLDAVRGLHLDVDEARGRLNLSDGKLRIDPFFFRMAGGQSSLRLVADARNDLPLVSLDFVADTLNLGDILAQIEAQVPLDGQLSAILRLEAAGNSARSLAKSLGGDFVLALANGQIQTGLLDATVVNPITWAFSRSARRGYSNLNCFLAGFDVDNGVAQNNMLVLDTTNVLAQGTGTINLRDETIDIAIRPRAKRRHLVRLAIPFRIQGPLSGPSVRVHRTGAVTRMTGQTLASPINMLGSLSRLFSSRRGDADNPCLNLQNAVIQ